MVISPLSSPICGSFLSLSFLHEFALLKNSCQAYGRMSLILVFLTLSNDYTEAMHFWKSTKEMTFHGIVLGVYDISLTYYWSC